jgi:hypothetical protein
LIFGIVGPDPWQGTLTSAGSIRRAFRDKAADAAHGLSLRTNDYEAPRGITGLFEMRNRIAHRGKKLD